GAAAAPGRGRGEAEAEGRQRPGHARPGAVPRRPVRRGGSPPGGGGPRPGRGGVAAGLADAGAGLLQGGPRRRRPQVAGQGGRRDGPGRAPEDAELGAAAGGAVPAPGGGGGAQEEVNATYQPRARARGFSFLLA